MAKRDREATLKKLHDHEQSNPTPISTLRPPNHTQDKWQKRTERQQQNSMTTNNRESRPPAG